MLSFFYAYTASHMKLFKPTTYEKQPITTQFRQRNWSFWCVFAADFYTGSMQSLWPVLAERENSSLRCATTFWLRCHICILLSLLSLWLYKARLFNTGWRNTRMWISSVLIANKVDIIARGDCCKKINTRWYGTVGSQTVTVWGRQAAQ